MKSTKRAFLLAAATGFALLFSSVSVVSAEVKTFDAESYQTGNKEVDQWADLTDTKFKQLVSPINNEQPLARKNNSLGMIVPDNYWQPERYCNLVNLEPASGHSFSQGSSKSFQLIDNSQSASVTVPHYLHHNKRWVDAIYTFKLKGDNTSHDWAKSNSRASVYLNLGTSYNRRNWFSLWTNSAAPRGYYQTDVSSRWDINVKFVYSDDQSPVKATGTVEFPSVNTQFMYAFDKQQMLKNGDRVYGPAPTGNKQGILRGNLDSNGQYFDVRGASRQTGSGTYNAETTFLYVFHNGELNFTNVKTGSTYPNAMFSRNVSEPYIAQEVPYGDLVGTINKQGKITETSDDQVDDQTPGTAQVRLYQAFPNQPTAQTVKQYQVQLTLPKYAKLTGPENLELNNYNYQKDAAKILKTAKVSDPKNNANGTQTYTITFGDGKTAINDNNLQLKINAQIDWDNPELLTTLKQNFVKAADGQKYLAVKAKTKTIIDGKTMDNGQVTTKVEEPKGKVNVHYVDGNQTDLQKPVSLAGVVNAGFDIEMPQTVVDTYNEEYQVTGEVKNAAGEKVDPKKLRYQYNSNKPQDLYVIYQDTGHKFASILNGKRVGFLGSSVTVGWQDHNHSFVDNLREQDGLVAFKEAVTGTTLAGQGSNTYVHRLLKMKDGNTAAGASKGKNALADEPLDAFVLQVSTNDANSGYKLGSVSDSKELQDFDINTVAGAMEYIIKYAEDTWHCPIILYTGYYENNAKYQQMVDLTYQLQKKWHFTLLDIYHNQEVHDLFSSDKTKYVSANDFIHPRHAGYQVWTDLFRQTLTDVFNNEVTDK
ncbi:SGNH/GDSL hydrolase family protein [Lactobacillus sp. ESL0681]|uniref:SGNH/GDSL hydrolase family protein n=1 Tax=Lactobacillus sp. ESL0681 TaxID=2983211 RepID=UPI0023F7515A|nr:SGNH/GDSL hydrolase family protein [Lactobacillus sp. ESL0681]WEV39534.1 SGNH/GDSL hydrolase family protein [Lactobacillus sp. ESL0681]